MRIADIETLPMYDPVSHLVYAAGREHVSDVWVAGVSASSMPAGSRPSMPPHSRAARAPGNNGSSEPQKLTAMIEPDTAVTIDRVVGSGNADPAELAKFSALAHRWWDPQSEFKPLHEINPLRLGWIERVAGGLAGKRVLDVGCGGGILAEAMARARRAGHRHRPVRKGARGRAAAPARIRARTSTTGSSRPKTLALEMPGAFDVVTCMEMLEHVPDPASMVAACATLAKPGGIVVFSTINRNPKSYALAILGAEYVLRLLPRGTHDWTALHASVRARGFAPARAARSSSR